MLYLQVDVYYKRIWKPMHAHTVALKIVHSVSFTAASRCHKALCFCISFTHIHTPMGEHCLARCPRTPLGFSVLPKNTSACEARIWTSNPLIISYQLSDCHYWWIQFLARSKKSVVTEHKLFSWGSKHAKHGGTEESAGPPIPLGARAERKQMPSLVLSSRDQYLDVFWICADYSLSKRAFSHGEEWRRVGAVTSCGLPGHWCCSGWWNSMQIFSNKKNLI